MSKESLKDKLDGNELDLSLSNLTKVPVKELAALPKATSLDLSCNKLTSLPDSFTSLIHLVRIDLSKNNLTELPNNFGRLERLQHLDLLGNQLQMVPVSIAWLKNLRWLDLKENPLEPTLKKVVGDCLDDKQCKACAQRVIQHMRAIQAEQDQLQQKKMEEERIQEAARQEEEAKQKQLKKRQKQQEKERRRKEYEAAQAAKRLQEQTVNDKGDEEEEETEVRENGLQTQVKTSSGFSCMSIFLMLIVVLIAVCVGVYFFCETDRSNALCVDIHWGLDQAQHHINHMISRAQQQLDKWMK